MLVLLLGMIVLFVPFFITISWSNGKAVSGTNKKEIPVSVAKNGQTIILSEDEYIKGALAGSMPMTFEDETLQAQVVIIRTILYRSYLQSGDTVDGDKLGLSYVTMEQLKNEIDTKQYEVYVKKINSAIQKTKDQIIVYADKPIDAHFHYCNAGKTRDYEKVYGEKKEYLVSVDSSADIKSDLAMTVKKYKRNDLIDLLKEQLGITTLSEETLFDQIQIVKKDEEGYIISAKIGDSNISGDELSEVLSLNSCNFTIQDGDGQIQFIVKGKGEGIGFSQFGANEMAKEGTGYEELLKYYYKDVSIEKYSLK
ncbi:stage II sporulation protein D [Lachnospiraceae bacterium KM106-2]|nr:stage II sporulation protein D [Lachnospiraceae bacterium KM106-2]